jgi:hypothetical protein
MKLQKGITYRLLRFVRLERIKTGLNQKVWIVMQNT